MSKERSTERRQQRFLEAIRRGCTVAEAARHAGVARGTVYVWAARDPGFEEAWKDAEYALVVSLRNQAYDLAMGGNVRVLIWLLESQERKAASGSSSTEERIGQIEIIGLKEGESRDGDFIEFVES